MLKLEYLVHVLGTSIDEFLQELNYLISSTSVTFSRGFVSDILERHSLQVNEQVVTEITKAVNLSNPVQRATEKGGPLSTSYLCKTIYKEKLGVVDPVTYVLNHRKKNTIQYVPLLKSLQQILNCKVLLDQIIKNHKGQQDIEIDPAFDLRSPKDGSHFKENSFFNAEELKILLRLYVDDFETCNPWVPLGRNTSFLAFIG